MNEETNKLRKIIEQATAAPGDSPRDLDAEAASLRRGWLQLGKLIEEEIGISGVEVGNRPVPVPLPAARRKLAWPLWNAASMAALIVAAGIVFAVRSLSDSHEPQKNLQQVAKNDSPVKETMPPGAMPKSAPLQTGPPELHTAATADPTQWGDSVDDEITAVGEATIYAKQDAYAQSSGVWGIQSGLDQLKQEVDQGKL